MMVPFPVVSTEIYLHSPTRDGFTGCAPGYRYADEFADALLIANRNRRLPLRRQAARGAAGSLWRVDSGRIGDAHSRLANPRQNALRPIFDLVPGIMDWRNMA
jgi:hypothetical protein